MENNITDQDKALSNENYLQGLSSAESGDLEATIAHLNKAIRINDHNVEAYTLRAKTKNKLGAYRYSVYDCIQANTFGTPEQTQFLKEFISFYTEQLELNPDTADLYYARGQVNFLLGLNNDAVSDLLKVIEINPDDVEAYSVISNIMAAMGDVKGAKKYHQMKEDQLYKEMMKLTLDLE